jgi:hypothetical protein
MSSLAFMLVLFVASGNFRHQLILFVRGAPLDSLRDLQWLTNAMLFIPNVEIGIERQHAVVSQRIKIAHHHSAAFVSLALRRQELMDEHSTNFTDLAECADRVSDRRRAVEQLGLMHHPSLSPYLRADETGLDHSVPHSLVNQVSCVWHVFVWFLHD